MTYIQRERNLIEVTKDTVLAIFNEFSAIFKNIYSAIGDANDYRNIKLTHPNATLLFDQDGMSVIIPSEKDNMTYAGALKIVETDGVMYYADANQDAFFGTNEYMGRYYVFEQDGYKILTKK